MIRFLPQQTSLAIALALAAALLTSCQVAKYVIGLEKFPSRAAPTQPYVQPAAAQPSVAAPDEVVSDDDAPAIAQPRRLESGLLVEVLRVGKGPICRIGSKITVRYEGALGDGTIIDASGEDESRGPWPVDQLMPGWRQGLIGMRAGGKRRIVIPPALAYGDREVVDPETGDLLIPGGATLSYVIELMEVR